MHIVLQRLPGVDVRAVVDLQHQDFNGKDVEVACDGVTLKLMESKALLKSMSMSRLCFL